MQRSGLNPRTLTPPDDEPGRGAPVVVAPSVGPGVRRCARCQAVQVPSGAAGRSCRRCADRPPVPGGARRRRGATGTEPAARRRGAASAPKASRRGPGGGAAPPASAAASEAGGGGGPFGAQVAPVPAKTFDLAERVFDRRLVRRRLRRSPPGSPRDRDRRRRREGIARRGAHRDPPRPRDDRHHAAARARRAEDHQPRGRTQSRSSSAAPTSWSASS